MKALLARADRPLVPAVAALALALAVVGVQAQHVGGISAFAHVAPPWADPAAVPVGVRVVGAPYDGMFYYRLALDPLTSERSAYGITFDRPAYRQQRIVYPLLAYVVSGGDARRAPAALVAVNVVALALVGLLGGLLARASGRHALWGFVFAGWPGLLITLSGDLTELVAGALALAALLLIRRGRSTSAAVALAAAVLARETTVLLAAAWWIAMLRSSPRSPRRWLPALLPVAVLAVWQLTLALRWHETAASEGASSVGPPLLGLLAAAWLDPQRYPPADLAVWASMIAFVLALAVIGIRSLAGGRPHERLAWWGYASLATTLEANIWANGAILRTLTELGFLTALLSLGATVRARGTLVALEGALLAVLLASGPRI